MKQRLESYPYVLPFLLVGLSLLSHFIGPPGQSPLLPQMLFFSAVAVSAWIGGIGPGLVATGLSVFAIDVALVEPIGSTSVDSITDLSRLIVFAAESVLICVLFHLLRKSNLQLEKSLEATEATLGRVEEANQLKRNFIANMSHEIRAPLSAVLGFSDLLADDKIPAIEKRAYVDRLKVNASSLTLLVTDLLDVTEIDPGYFVANRRKMSVPAFMQKVYELFSPSAQEKRLKFQVHLRGSVQQLLNRIKSNSCKFSVTLSETRFATLMMERFTSRFHLRKLKVEGEKSH